MTGPSLPCAPDPDRPARPRLALHWQILVALILGAVLGLSANRLARRSAPPAPPDPWDQDANGVHDRLDWWVLNVTDPLGKVFLRLIFMVVVPLVFSALALGAVEIGDVRRLGSLGLKTLGLTAMFSTCAVAIGLVLVNTLQPGNTIPAAEKAALRAQYARNADATLAAARQAKPLKDVLLDIIPENPLQEMVGAVDASSKGNGMLAVMFFALTAGIAMAADPQRCRTLIGCVEGLYALSMGVIGLAMRLAPLGVACLVFGVTARLGTSLVAPLAGFMATVLLGLAVQLVVVYPVALAGLGRVPPHVFFSRIREAVLMAFGTASSNATLPTALRVAEAELGVPRDVSRFVLTIGATGNQNGTALYEGVVVLFLAQVFQVPLSLPQQALVLLMSVLAGIGTAGVPGGSLPLIVVVMQSVGVPGEGIGLILGIDRLLDMCRTVVNVTGDLTIACCVGRQK